MSAVGRGRGNPPRLQWTEVSEQSLPVREEMLIGGEWVGSDTSIDVLNKYTGERIARVASASRHHVAEAAAAAEAAMEHAAPEPFERFKILRRASDLVSEHGEQLARTMVSEGGFTTSEARVEVDRCSQTLLLSAEEAKRIHGDVVPIHGAPGQERRLAFTIRVPIGPVCAITPFNAPLNTPAHKIAPAFAAGNAVVLKPSSLTPLSSALLCEIMAEAGVPPGFINLVHGSGSDCGRWLVEEPRFAFYAFTGSTSVGRSIHSGAGLRRTQMELGSISGTIVCSDADLDWAVERCVGAAYRKAGQVCTSVQRLYVERSIADEFADRLGAAVRVKTAGDPSDPSSFIGPMISEDAAIRAEAWVDEAVEGGARIIAGGRRKASLFEPTVLNDVDARARVICEEAFAPIVSIVPFDDLDTAIQHLNGTPYGLAAGVFTQNISTAFVAARQLHVGTVHINESSSSRVDLAPYGGTKDSGHGREGPKYAIEEMTEERLITITLRPLGSDSA